MSQLLFLHQLDESTSRGCNTPGCSHDHSDGLFLTPLCHPGVGVRVEDVADLQGAAVLRRGGAAVLAVSTPRGAGRADHAPRSHPGVSPWERAGRAVSRGEPDGELPALPHGAGDRGCCAVHTRLMDWLITKEPPWMRMQGISPHPRRMAVWSARPSGHIPLSTLRTAISAGGASCAARCCD